MLTNIKPLILILSIACAVFFLARPICIQFMSAEDFDRRRNVWLSLTVVAFLSPHFVLYAAFAVALLLWASRKDPNPLALFAFITFTIPNISYYIPGGFVNQLFALTQYRILSLVVVLPAIVAMWKQSSEPGRFGLKTPDVLLLAFLLLQVITSMPYEYMTNTMRRAFLFAIDSFVVFYAFSRLNGQTQIRDVMASFWMACAIMAPIAVFETFKGWLLYTGLADAWGDPNVFSWLFRGGSLRAQAAAEHSINLGFVLSVGLGFFLYMRSQVSRGWLKLCVLATFCAGIYVTGARGPWITAALIIVLFVLIRPESGRQMATAVGLGVLAVGLMYVSPLKESVLDRLPFIGSADQDTVEYRRQLAEVSWTIIKQNPFFGDPFAYLQLEEMRQGQGIIDIVNGYIHAALFTGFVGLGLLVSIFALALWRGGFAFVTVRTHDFDEGLLGASLVATFVASLVYIATAGYGTTTYILAGLLFSFAKSVSRPSTSHYPTPFAVPVRPPARSST